MYISINIPIYKHIYKTITFSTTNHAGTEPGYPAFVAADTPATIPMTHPWDERYIYLHENHGFSY